MLRTCLSILLFLFAPPLWAAKAAPGAAPAPWGHLEYFGFYASAMGDWNFTGELAPYTNLTWIHVGGAADPEGSADRFVTRLREAQDAGVRAVLSIEPFLFADPAGTPRSDAEIEYFLVELRARIELHGLGEAVAMIYPKDEPFREFKRHRDPNWYEEYVSGEVFADIHRDLDQVNAVIRRVFPDTPIGVIYSGYHLDSRFLSVPESYDWVGFNCYDSLYRACGGRSFVELYARLLDHMTARQRLMAVPETWVRREEAERTDWPAVLTSRLRHHYEMALGDPRFVAFVPFLWSVGSAEGTPGFGLDRFPELYDDEEHAAGTEFVVEVLALGQEVKEGNPRYPNLAWAQTEAHPARPDSELRAGIAAVDRRGWVDGWAVDRALPHKNLRGRIVLRDAGGRVVYKSPLRRADRPAPADASEAAGVSLRLGRHGFRFEVPKALFRSSFAAPATVELIAYPDGPLRRASARIIRMDWNGSPGRETDDLAGKRRAD